MKKMMRYSFIAALAAISLTSCKKDDEPTQKSRTELLTSANWKLTSDQEKIGTGAWQEYITTLPACELDNYIKFNSNNTFDANEGATKCDPSDPQSFPGTWAFENGETQINIFGQVGTIDELTSTRLTVSSTETFGGTTYSYKQVYSH